MGSFTLELNEVLEFTEDIGLDEYPIFDEEYRPTLNRKITRHFYNQEIGMETISMFQLAMSRLMDEIMPYYNELYKFDLLQADPLSTVDIKTFTTNKDKTTATGESTADSSSDAKSRAVSSDFPQQALQANSDYATSAQDNISNSSGNSTNSESRNNVTDGTVDSSTKGYNGHAPQLIQAARAALINVDLMIIGEIDRAGLFMLITSLPDSFTNNRGFYNGIY